MPHANKFIHFVVRVVKGERRADGAFEAEVPLRRHRAMMPSAHGDAMLVEVTRDFFVPHARVNEVTTRCKEKFRSSGSIH